MKPSSHAGAALPALLVAVALALSACGKAAPPAAIAAGTGAAGERYDDTRFDKIAADGRTLALDEGPWACIHDRRSGLTWENKTDNERLHYAAATYSWYDPAQGLGYPDRGSCRDDLAQIPCDSDDLLRAANTRRLCGFDDWRLPTAAELGELVTDEVHPGEATIVGCFFPYTQRSPYLSSDIRRNAQGDLEVATVNFRDGGVQWLPIGRPARLRLVRGR